MRRWGAEAFVKHASKQATRDLTMHVARDARGAGGVGERVRG